MARRSFNLPIALARFCVSARALDPRRSILPFLLFSIPPICTPLIWQTLPDRYPRIVFVHSRWLCNLRFWLMFPSRWSNDRSIVSGLLSSPVSAARFFPCLLYVATFDITIPRDALQQRSVLSQARFWRVSETTGEGLHAVVLDFSAWIRSTEWWKMTYISMYRRKVSWRIYL